MTKKTKLEWALDLAARGFEILRVEAYGKTPFAGYSWAEHASKDPEVIASWFDETPDMNYGVHCGDEYAIVDLDIKARANGITRFEEMQLDVGFAPEDDVSNTFQVKTPSGGRHLYFKVDGPRGSSNKFGPAIDVRGHHGYVVGPGCVGDNRGVYVAINSPDNIMKAPAWIESRMKRPGDRSEHADKPLVELDLPASVTLAENILEMALPAIEGLGGDTDTYKLAAKLKDAGVSEEMALHLMMKPGGWNSRNPTVWSVTDLQRKIYNGYHYGQEQPGLMAPDDFSDMVVDDYDRRAFSKDEPGDVEFSRLRKITFDASSLLARTVRREMIVPEWLPAQGMTALLARRSVGKTVVMMDMALRVACDLSWHGHPVDKDWVSIYVCGEDDEGASEHFRAWNKKFDMIPDYDRFRFCAATPDLLSLDDVEEWTLFLKSEVGSSRAVVFLDTWQRATARASQSNDEEVQKAIHHAEAIAKSLRGPVVAAFHPPKHAENTVMGSSVIENSTSAIWHMSQGTSGRRLEVTRMKGKGDGNYLVFDFEEIKLGEKDAFDLEKSGIVPSVMAGNFDNNLQEMNNKKREAYAKLFVELDKHRFDYKKSNDPFNKGELSGILEKIYTRSIERDAEGEIVNKEDVRLINILSTAGIKTVTTRTVRDELSAIFKPGQGGVRVTADGETFVVSFTATGRSQKLVVEADSS